MNAAFPAFMRRKSQHDDAIAVATSAHSHPHLTTMYLPSLHHLAMIDAAPIELIDASAAY